METIYPNSLEEIKIQLELGPGRGRQTGSVITMDMCGNDYVQPEILGMVGFTPFPLADNSVDRIVAYNFMEHLPRACYFRENGEWFVHRPIIYTFEEAYRVLKVGGTFEMYNPASYTGASCGDPTHLSEWDTCCIDPYFRYDCQVYDMRFNFDAVKNTRNGSEFNAIMMKNKEDIFIPNPPKCIWRPAPVDPKDYYVLTLDRVKWAMGQCGWGWKPDTKEFYRNI